MADKTINIVIGPAKEDPFLFSSHVFSARATPAFISSSESVSIIRDSVFPPAAAKNIGRRINHRGPSQKQMAFVDTVLVRKGISDRGGADWSDSRYIF